MSQPYDIAVYIGRFQPFHKGHLALLRRALGLAPRCVVVLGSAFHARTPVNPFTWEERRAVILGALPADERSRLEFLPVRDYYDESRWARVVREGVETDGAGARIALVGHFKDDSSSYLRAFPDWTLEHMERQGSWDGSELRERCFAEPAAALAALADAVPASTLDFLRHWLDSAEFAARHLEWRMLADYKAAWAGAPYPPVFVTADAVVTCAGKVLLIERGRMPGLGLYALPGGFIEQNETMLQSALRELREETGLELDAGQMTAEAIFDHPRRSVRGRTITHAFHFDLAGSEPPPVTAGDDATGAAWFATSALAAIEDRFLDDHFIILDRFLELLPR